MHTVINVLMTMKTRCEEEDCTCAHSTVHPDRQLIARSKSRERDVGSHHGGLCVAAKRVLQQARELAVAIGDVLRFAIDLWRPAGGGETTHEKPITNCRLGDKEGGGGGRGERAE